MAKIKFYFLWLSLICIGAFILQVLIQGVTELFLLNNKAVYKYEVWRFVTAIFMHGGVVHLLYNLVALLFFGIVLENLIGSKRFLIIFLFSGIIANIVSVNFYPASLGASGAIMGIIGALTIIRPMMMVWAFGLILPMFIAAILWVIGDTLGIFMPSGVGNIAHLSGIAVGFLTGFLMRKLVRENKKKSEKIKIPEDYMKSWEDRYMR
jgi:uncharacterized protein